MANIQIKNCKLCRENGKPKSVYTSHCERDVTCPFIMSLNHKSYKLPIVSSKTTKVETKKKPGFEIFMSDSESEDDLINNDTLYNLNKTKKTAWADMCDSDDDCC